MAFIKEGDSFTMYQGDIGGFTSRRWLDQDHTQPEDLTGRSFVFKVAKIGAGEKLSAAVLTIAATVEENNVTVEFLEEHTLNMLGEYVAQLQEVGGSVVREYSFTVLKEIR